MKWVIGLAVVGLVYAYQSGGTEKLEFINPLIPKYGPVVPMPKAVEQPNPKSKVVFDFTAYPDPKSIHKGFERVAVLLNLSMAQKVEIKQMEIVVVLHGDATKSCLASEAYEQRFGCANPNVELLGELHKHGVKVMVCGQALARQGLPMAEVANNVEIATSALTAIINKQMAGYAYIPMH
jgi:intracellular sulfur oxidation DsrE/DsrF family protein